MQVRFKGAPRRITACVLIGASVWIVWMTLRPGSAAQTRDIAVAMDASIPEIMREMKVPGLSIALIRGGELVWSGAFGVRDATSNAPVDHDTVFEAGSMSKPLLAYSALKLVDTGMLELDRPLDSYLPNPYLPDQALAPQITTRMALLHTTGLPMTRRGGWQAGGPVELLFEPGTRFFYGNEGFLYLQRVVEQLTQQDFGTFAEKSLLRPLAMTRSSFRWEERFADDFAVGHDDDGNPKIKREFYDQPHAAYSLYTTASDFARFLVMLLDSDPASEHALGPELREGMVTVQWREQAHKSIRTLGWRIDPGSGYVHHSGASGSGFRCFSRFHPERGDGLVIMTNSGSGHRVRDAVVEVVSSLEDVRLDDRLGLFVSRTIENVRRLYFSLFDVGLSGGEQPEP